MSTKQEQFGRWLQDELNRRKLSREDFSKRAGVAKGTINNIVHADKQPQAKTIKKIAAALRLPTQDLLERAGIVDPVSTDSADMRLLEYVYEGVSPERRRTLIRFAEFLRREQAEEDELKEHGGPRTWHHTQKEA